MIGLDTNVLVRYLAQDDPVQSALATRVVEQELSATQPGYISLVVLIEVCWVLRSLFAATEAEIIATVQDLLLSPQLRVAERDAVKAVAQRLSQRKTPAADFADALIAELATRAGCSHTLSFDRNAVKRAGMKLLCD